MEGMLAEHLPEESSDDSRGVVISLLCLLLTISSGLAFFFAYKYQTALNNPEVILQEKIVIQEKTVYRDSPTESSSQPGIIDTRINSTAAPSTSTIDRTGVIPKRYAAHPLDIMTADSDESSSQDLVVAEDRQVTELKAIKSTNQGIAYEADVAGLFFEQVEEEEEEVVRKQWRKRLKFSLGVLANVTRDLEYTGLGLTSGLDLILSKRLSVNTGVGISYFSREGYFFPHVGQLRVPSETTSLADVYYQGLRSFKQVYVPFHIDYALTKSLAITSGVRLRYTYDEDINRALPIPNATPTRGPVVGHEEIYNNTNLGFSAGVRYSFSPHFSILLDSEWGISNLLSKAQFTKPSEISQELNLINFRTNYTF